MSNIGIVCSLWAEAKPFLSWHPPPRVYRFKHLTWIEMRWQKHHLRVVVSKVGKKNAIRAAKLIIKEHFPELVVNFGSAGAIASGMKIGDIVVACATAEYLQPPPLCSLLVADSRVLSIARDFPQIRLGPIVSGDQNIDSEILKKKLYLRYKALCGDWESAVVMRTCREHQTAALAFRVITDLGNKNTTADFERFHADVLQKAALLLKQYLNCWSPMD